MTHPTVATHSGDFHPDDVFAVATLKLAYRGDIDIVRSRDPDVVEKADIVVDVGGVYDEVTNRFDHHQAGGAGVRENGVPYASFGLVWNKFGEKIAGSKSLKEVVEKKLVVPIDAMDNGISIYSSVIEGVGPYLFDDFVFALRPTWNETGNSTEAFLKTVDIAVLLLQREIVQAEADEKAEAHIAEAYRASKNKQVIVLDKSYPWKELMQKYPEPLFVVYPDAESGMWHVRAVWESEKQFKNKKDFPLDWAGKRDHELAEATGVSDAVFCHNKRFIAVSKSKEGAIKLAELATQS